MNQDKEKAPAGQGEGQDTRKVNQMSNTNDIKRTLGARLACMPLPSRGEDVAPEDGYVYIIEFSDGTIKVGRTRDLSKRSGSHRRDGEKFGISVVRQWGSPAHRDFESTENLLKSFAAENSELQGGNEYFTGLEFEAAVRFVESLDLRASTEEEVRRHEEQRIESTRWIRELARKSEEMLETHLFITIDDDLAAWPLQQYFRSDYPLPVRGEDVEGGLLGELLASVGRIDEMTGSRRGESAEDWSTVDLMEYLLDVVTETAKERLRSRVINEGRFDLLDPFFEVAS